jgi:hypothetical protein
VHAALAESVIGLFKTELIKAGGPWRTVEQVQSKVAEPRPAGGDWQPPKRWSWQVGWAELREHADPAARRQ